MINVYDGNCNQDDEHGDQPVVFVHQIELLLDF